ncbi:MAG TPA: hypothetical protein VLC98_03490 [Phnomibacter sp.]|nr:hypothetical protein [Phnomibacter sp.]
MDGIGTLLIIQVVYIATLFFIIRSTIRQGRKATFYWFIVALYIVTIAWLVAGYISMPKSGNGGYGFAIGMYSMIVPGILTFVAAIVFAIRQGLQKGG